jgi:hypothetical protein
MDTESRRRPLREYVWFSLILIAVLLGVAAKDDANKGIRSQSAATLPVSSSLR